jgi:hypothetical protein
MDQPELMGTAALTAARSSARVSEPMCVLPEFDALYEEQSSNIFQRQTTK